MAKIVRYDRFFSQKTEREDSIRFSLFLLYRSMIRCMINNIIIYYSDIFRCSYVFILIPHETIVIVTIVADNDCQGKAQLISEKEKYKTLL